MADRHWRRYSGRTVLAIGAHPGDVEVGMGGTVAAMIEHGANVLVVAVCVPNRFALRLGEAQTACQILGAKFHLLRDRGSSRVEDMRTYELVSQIDQLVTEHHPAALFVHGRGDVHKDHRLVFEAFQASLRVGGMDAFCYQACHGRLGQAAFAPQAFVDIGATLERKIAAIEAHQSQSPQRATVPDFHRDLARHYGQQSGVKHAEGLEVIHLAL